MKSQNPIDLSDLHARCKENGVRSELYKWVERYDKHGHMYEKDRVSLIITVGRSKLEISEYTTPDKIAELGLVLAGAREKKGR